jgi:hypothetical protein
MATSRPVPAAILLGDGRVLILGGATSAFHGPEVYDPTTGNWAGGSRAPGPQGHYAVALLPDGNVLVSEGGRVKLYDPVTDAWTTASPLSRSWRGYSATLLSDGSVLMAGGWNAERGSSPVERYDPGGE